VDLGSPQFKVAAACRILFRAGLDPDDMAGQVALRDDDAHSYWTSPMETFDVTVPESLARVRLDGGEAGNGGTASPTGAVPVSAASRWVGAVFSARPDIACVVHTHAPYIGVVATTGQVVGLYNNRSLIFYRDQAFYDDDGTSTDSPERIVRALGDNNVLIMRNHGAVAVGESIEVATMRAVLLERAAQFQVRAEAIGGKPFSDNPAFERRRAPHVVNLPLLWDSHFRRLRRTDPDLFEAVERPG